IDPGQHHLNLRILGEDRGDAGSIGDALRQRRVLVAREVRGPRDLEVSGAVLDRAVPEPFERLRHEAAGERDRRESEDDYGAGQEAPPPVPGDVPERERDEAHTVRPSFRVTTRRARATTHGSWDESTNATPRAALIEAMRSSTPSAVFESRFAVGS